MSADNVRWGIISLARIGEMAFIPAVRQTERGELVAVVSRDRDRASSFAQKHGIPRVFDDYRSMLASDEIDAVYNPLPNTMHREWTELAAANGKHIFCEKPLTTKVAACEKAGVLFLEAFGEEPVGFQSVCKMDEDYEVDTRVAMVLEFSRRALPRCRPVLMLSANREHSSSAAKAWSKWQHPSTLRRSRISPSAGRSWRTKSCRSTRASCTLRQPSNTSTIV